MPIIASNPLPDDVDEVGTPGGPVVNMASLMRPNAGPLGEFFKEHLGSKIPSLNRNTQAHWHVHWHVKTRGRPLVFPNLFSQHLAAARIQTAWRLKSRLQGRPLQRMATAHVEPEKPPPPLSRRARIWRFTEENSIYNTLILVTIVLSSLIDIVATEIRLLRDPSADAAVWAIEATCVSIFTVEYFMRVTCCPSLKAFCRSPMNWVDVFAILPFYVSVIVRAMEMSVDSGYLALSTMLRLVRLTRVARVFKFARYSSSVLMFSVAISSSLHSLLVLLLVMTIVVILFGSVLFYAEENVDHDDNCGNECFSSILSSCWFIISTMTTTGYGDSYPVTTFGRVIGGAAACAGIIVLALPIAVFQINFAKIHTAREVCSRVYKDITLNDGGPVDIQKLQLWVELQIEKGRLSRDAASRIQGGVVKAEKGQFWRVVAGRAKSRLPAIASLSAAQLMETYDMERKGYLTEGEALLMVADLDEFHGISTTVPLNAAVHRLTECAELVSRTLSGLERETFGDAYANAALQTQRDALNDDKPVLTHRSTLESMRAFFRTFVTRQDHWNAPEREPETNRRKSIGGKLQRVTSIKSMNRIVPETEADDSYSLRQLAVVDRFVTPAAGTGNTNLWGG